MSFKGLTIGDCHFDKMRKHFPEQHIELQTNEIRKVYRHGQREGIRRVFWLGDIGEGYKDFTGNLVMSEEAKVGFLNLLLEVDGEFDSHIYIGNHDFSGLDSHTCKMFLAMYRGGLFKTTHFYEAETVLKIGGVRTTILPYPLLKPTSPKPSLCFAHYEVKGSVRDNGRKVGDGEKHKYEGHTFIQGHLHTRQVVRKQHYYPGTLYQTSFGESLPKGFMEFEARSGSKGLDFKHKFIDTDPAFKLINLKVHKRSDLEQIENNPLYKYKLFVSEDVRLTEQDLAPYSNISNQMSFSDEKELQALEAAEFVIENQTVDIDYEKALEDYLKTTKGFTDKQLKRCKELLSKRSE